MSEDGCEEISGGGIKVIGNKIFFYTDVSDDSVFEFVTKLHSLEHLSKVTVFIKSGGGDLYSGLCAMDHMRASPLHITTVADGMCASSATLILFGGNVRLMLPNSRVLIHQISSDFSGKFEELRAEKKHLKSIMKQIRNVYETDSKIPAEKLDKYMEKDVYLKSSTCLRLGIVNGIYGQ
jgi:ATP-dependent Clp endopeptidase proteolytic subunit ClpP